MYSVVCRIITISFKMGLTVTPILARLEPPRENTPKNLPRFHVAPGCISLLAPGCFLILWVAVMGKCFPLGNCITVSPGGSRMRK